MKSPIKEVKYDPKYRSNILVILGAMNEIVLREEHKSTLEKAPFPLFFESVIENKVDKTWCR